MVLNENTPKRNSSLKEYSNKPHVIALLLMIGALLPTIACSAVTATACELNQGLSGSTPGISAYCKLPMNRGVAAAIGGLEPIPDRKIHAFEIFSFPNDGKAPVDDIHIQAWWETTDNRLSFPRDLPPIVRIGR